MDKQIDILITKFLSGNTTEKENRELQNWRHVNSENETYFDAFQAAWKKAGLEKEEKEVDVAWAWSDLQQRLGSQVLGAQVIVKPRKLMPLRIAAGFLLLVMLSVVLALIFTDTTEKPTLVAMQKVPTTVDTDVKKLAIPDTFVVNEIAQPVRSKARVKPRKKKAVEDISEMFTLVTTDSAKAFQLPDNSIVYLNAHSTLNYAKDFNVNSRKVSLVEGEAYFEISRDSLPFEVVTRNTVTRGKETSFNVRSYEKDEQVEVIVVNGNAEFTGVGKKNYKKLNLAKGESGIAKKNGKVTKIGARKDYKWWQKNNLRARFKRLIAKIKVALE